MPARKSRPASSKTQPERFIEMARELGCDESEAAFDEALRKAAQSKPLPQRDTKKRKEKSAAR